MNMADVASIGRVGDLAQELNPLEILHQKIAALKIRCEAEHSESASATTSSSSSSTSATTDLPLVPIFNLKNEPLEALCADSDNKRRTTQIVKTLRERGALRVLGAKASPEIAEAIASLYDSHPNFTTATDYVLGEEILARQRGGAVSGLRLLLHGGAGVGKSDFSLTLAKLLGVPCEVISLSSSQASAHLAGSEEYWGNTQPGTVWKRLIQGTHANPIFVLDEIDKVCHHWGDPLGALYQLLEPKTAAVFADKSIPWLPVDTRYCNWIATANDIDPIHEAIRSRFTLIEVDAPSEDALVQLVQRLYKNLLDEFALTDRLAVELSDAQTRALIGGSIRDAKRILRSAIASALRQGKREITVEPKAPASTSQRIGFI